MSDLIAEPGAIPRAAPTDNDWDEIKADIKEIVQLLRSQAPKPKEAEPQREFHCEPEVWLKCIQPTPQRLENLAGVLLSMFVMNKERILMPGCSYRGRGFLPSFAHGLTLRIPIGRTSQDVNPTPKSPELLESIQRYIMEHKAEATYRIKSDEVAMIGAEVLDNVSRPVSAYGYGTLCMMRVDVENDFLDLHCINFALAIISRWNYQEQPHTDDPTHFESAACFLAIFAGLRPSRFERSYFPFRHDYGKHSGGSHNRFYLQVHFRYFKGTASPKSIRVINGLRCYRERGTVASDILGLDPYSFEEGRVSIFGIISGAAIDETIDMPSFYSVLVMGETVLHLGRSDKYDLKWRAGLEGTIAFQIAILKSLSAWEVEWHRALDGMDECLRVSFDEIEKWMFDDDFERSKLYFTILQVLRIFTDHIRTTSDEIQRFDDMFLRNPDFPMQRMRVDELQVVRSNWELVKTIEKKAEKGLLDRIQSKTEEVKSLRDGLFNATSLLEANRSSVMGRYVLIFTIVTVLYLPPSFISTVLDMDIFNKDLAETRWEYKVSLVSISLFTYIAALAGVIAVNWKNLKRRYLRWRDDFSAARTSNANSQGDQSPV